MGKICLIFDLCILSVYSTNLSKKNPDKSVKMVSFLTNISEEVVAAALVVVAVV